VSERLPFLKFYPGDWMQDAALRTCSVAARGLWIDVIAAMHANTNRRGYLELPTGKPMLACHVARIVGATEPEAAVLLAELEDAGVFSRTKEGTIYSRRMVRDDRQLQDDVKNGKRGGNPRLKGGVNPPVNPPVNPEANPPLKARSQKSEVRSQIPDADGLLIPLGSSTNTSPVLTTHVATDGGNPPPAAAATPPKKLSLKFEWDPEHGFVNVPIPIRMGWERAFPACNIDAELAKAHAWMQANPTKIKKNWAMFLQRWLAKEQDRGGTGSPPGNRAPRAVVEPAQVPKSLSQIIAERQAAAKQNGVHA